MSANEECQPLLSEHKIPGFGGNCWAPLPSSDSFRLEGGQNGPEHLVSTPQTIASQLFRRSAYKRIKCLFSMSILTNDSDHPHGSRFIGNAVLATTPGDQALSEVHHARNSRTMALCLRREFISMARRFSARRFSARGLFHDEEEED